MRKVYQTEAIEKLCLIISKNLGKRRRLETLRKTCRVLQNCGCFRIFEI